MFAKRANLKRLSPSILSIPRQIRDRLSFGLTGKVPDRRNIKIFDDDLLLVSYPKSGNTWVRLMCASLLGGKLPVDLLQMEKIIPTIYYLSPKRLDGLQRPRYLKSHEYLNPAYKKVLYIVRDPRDVCVSYYHFHRRGKRISKDYPIVDYIPWFVKGGPDHFGTWGDHVGGWVGARNGNRDFLCVRYEDLQSDTLSSLRAISKFLERDLDESKLAAIIRNCTSSRMRILEAQAGTAWIDGVKSDIPFVRAARSGSWVEDLPPESTKLITDAWGPVMSRLGYELDLNRPSSLDLFSSSDSDQEGVLDKA